MVAALIKDPASGLEYIAVGATENPKHMLVMLHGSGADYSDMEMAANLFAKKLPADTVILVPNGPYLFADILPPEQAEQIRNAGMDTSKMRSWFDAVNTQGMKEHEALEAVRKKMGEVGSRLNDFIAAKQKEFGLTDGDTAVYGFSQGGVLALQAGVERYPSPLAAVVSHSGYMLGFEYGYVKPRTQLIVGALELQDGQPMKEMHEQTAAFLREDLGVDVTEHVSPGLGHGLNMDTVKAATSFIAKAFAGPAAEVTNDLSAAFAKFAGAEVPVSELFKEKPEGQEILWVKVLDENSALMRDFRKAAHEAGFRDVRITTPTSFASTKVVPDRLTAEITKGQDGKYRLGGFKAG